MYIFYYIFALEQCSCLFYSEIYYIHKLKGELQTQKQKKKQKHKHYLNMCLLAEKSHGKMQMDNENNA